MALSLAQKFVNLGMASPLAVEYTAQINSGVYNWRRLAWLGMVPILAKYTAESLTFGTFDARTAMEKTMEEAIAALTKSVAIRFDPTNAKLRFSPPAQTSPTIITLNTGFWQGTSTAWTNTSGNGRANGPRAFADDEDVILIMPATARTGDFECTGGRNIRIIGGSFGPGRATFKDVCASLYLEGLSWAMTTAKDAINVFSKVGFSAKVFRQNLVIRGVRGVNAGVHGDAFQPNPGGLLELYTDNLTGDSNYQFDFIANQTGIQMQRALYSRTNLSYNAVVGEAVTYLPWMRDTDQSGGGGTGHYPIDLFGETCWIAPRAGQNIAEHSVQPALGSTINGIPVGAIPDALGDVTFPSVTLITGKWKTGTPPADYATGGLLYNSPGYQLPTPSMVG